MKYLTFHPPPSLAAYTRFFQVLESELAREGTYTHHAMADGWTKLIFYYKGHFGRVLATGTEVVMPLEDKAYGHSGRVKDPSGNT